MSDRNRKSKLEQSMDNLQRGIDKVFDSMTGEILIDEPGAPDRDQYDGQDDGYLMYLYDVHEWALKGFQEAVEDYQEAVANLEADEYPELGMHRREDEQQRRAIDDTLESIPEKRDNVVRWKEVLDRIEEAFRKRDEEGRSPI